MQISSAKGVRPRRGPGVNGRYWIEGLAGGEGVRVNGIPTERAALNNRDKVQIGGLEIEFFEW
jgi:pSer/pThr/pTyr-binding forkhead associated (FHA) protein